VPAASRSRREAAHANLRRAERRHRQHTLYSAEAEHLPGTPKQAVPAIDSTQAALFWTVPLFAVVAPIVVHAPPDNDPATTAAGPNPPPPPAVLAARELSVPLDYPGGIVVSPD